MENTSAIFGKLPKACLLSVLIAGCCLTTIGSATQPNDTAADQVVRAPLFQDPLIWVGPQPPDAESQALLADIDVFKARGIGPGFAALEQFVAQNPNSGWTPDIQVHLAEHDRACGRYAEALNYWQATWDKTKDSQDARGKELAVRTIAGWTRLLASLGQKDQMESIFGELASRHLPLGPYATKIQETKQGLAVMNTAPGKSYRCGSYALGHLARALNLSQSVIQQLLKTDSPIGGFTISELLSLARTNGLDVEAVRRPIGAPLVLPCVVHWKLNHYAAIIEEKNGRYRVIDPTFERSVWMDEATIDAEASGDFILPKNRVPSSWEELGQVVCTKIYGKGSPAILNNANDVGCGGLNGRNGSNSSGSAGPAPASKGQGSTAAQGSGGGQAADPGGVQPVDVQPKSDSSPQCVTCGMPQWSVSEPYENLWLKDTPLLYQQSDLSWERFGISYKQRGEAQISAICGFGSDWSCDWIDELQSDGSDTIADSLGSGGTLSFPLDGTAEYKTGGVLTMTQNDQGDAVPIIVSPVGSTNIYGYAVVYGGGATNYFLTQRIDQYGRVLEQFDYQSVGTILAQLIRVIDMDRHTNTLTYGNSTYSNLITEVTDPYSRTAHFNYDNNGLLTNIVDAQGMSTYFQYDDNNDVTNMITPYGTNSFQFFNSVDDTYTNAPSLAVLITEASGDHQLYEHDDNAVDPGGVDSDVSSYHWNRKQYAAISAQGKSNVFAMTNDDYGLASVKSFCYDSDNDGYTLGDTMYLEADPKDPVYGARTGEVRYQYDGQQNWIIGPLKRVVSIAWIDPTSSSGYFERVNMAYNALGNLTNYIYYNDSGPGPASYTNFYDPSGRILQYQTGPMGELTMGCGYSSAVPTLLTSITNAVGDVTRYTYDSHTRLTSITFPGGLVRTNIYYASGPEAGFLAQKIDIGFRTNSFVWQDGNLVEQTNELGLVTGYTYDNLNRLISIMYPDGTTVSNVYDKLDIIATKDRLNQWTYYGYNQVRQLMATTNVDGQVTTFDYCGCGAPDQIIHWNGATALLTQIAYNMAGLVTSVVYPDGYALSYTYDIFDRHATVTDTAGNQEGLSWAQHGLDSAVRSPTLNGVGMFSCIFDQYGRVIQNQDRNSVTVTNAYDSLGRLTARQFHGWEGNTLQQSGLELFNYSSWGLTNYIDKLGHATTYVRDLEGRIVAETNANNEVLQFAYNPADEMLTLTDGKNQTTLWNYDQFGRATNKVDMSGITDFVYQYDADDRLVSRRTPAKGTTIYRYDPLGNLTNVDYSGGTAYTPSIDYAYDFLNRLTNMLDGIGSSTFTWTPGDQLAGEAGPWLDDTVSYFYNGARQRSVMSLSQPNANPWTQTYGYDSLMRLSTNMSPAGGNFSSPMGTFAYAYSSAMDRPINIYMPGPANPTITDQYDGLARLNQTELPANGANMILAYSFDEGSEVTQQVFTAFSQYSYNINYAYDNIGQLKTAQAYEYAGTPRLQEQFGYAYDNAGNLSERTNNALIQNFAVNDVNELSSASQSGTLTVAGSTTEPSANANNTYPGVTNVTVNGQSAVLYDDGSFAADDFPLADGQSSYTAIAQDDAGRSSTNSVTVNVVGDSSYAYDSNGNLTSDGTRNFAYDDENQLVAVWAANAWSNSFAYDGFLRKRIEQQFAWNGGGWTETNEVHYIYDGNLVLQERDQNNNPLTTYTRGNDLSGTLQGAGGIGGLLARSDNQKDVPAILAPATPNPQNVVTSYYFNDLDGNVTALVSPSGMVLAQYKYDPFGNLISKSGLMADINKYRFSSKEWEQNAGLYYYGFRFYDPNLQRWLNQDPLGEKYDPNLYRYVYNSPLAYGDPNGMWGIFIGNNTGSSGINIGRGSPSYSFSPDSGIDGLQGLAAAADGALPVGDPFARLGAYDPNDPTLKASRVLGGVASVCLSGAGALKAAGISTKIALHGAHHEFPPFGRLPHVQLNWWRAGVKGSGGGVRLPVPPGTPGFPK